jgi:hypothetical protein
MDVSSFVLHPDVSSLQGAYFIKLIIQEYVNARR